MPQFVTLFLGLAMAAVLYNYAPGFVPTPLKLVMSGLVGLLVLGSVFIRPGGRSLWEWLLERVQFHFGTHVAVYGLRELREEMEEQEKKEFGE